MLLDLYYTIKIELHSILIEINRLPKGSLFIKILNKGI
jgi:hypothetical protein